MRFLVPALALLLALTASAHQYIKPYGELKDEQKFKDYTVRIYRNEQPPPVTDKNPDHQDGLGCFEILKAGKQVYFQKGLIFAVQKSGDAGDTSNQIIFGRSINGDGKPYLVMQDGTGCHCCENYEVFEVGDTFRFIQKIETTIGGQFKDLHRNGELELVMSDSMFEYWHCAGAENPYPTIILRNQDGKYVPDLELMRKPAPTEMALQKMAKDFKAKFVDVQNAPFFDKWTAPFEMWSGMLDLIYSGNRNAAWKLCDLSWPVDHSGKADFLKEFKAQLAKSAYHKDIERLNVGSQTNAL